MENPGIQESEDGFVFLIDKPSTWTSFDVVNKIRWTIREKKVGHAGTLDPLATGLVIVCSGKNTKKIDSFMGLEKEYTGTFFLGATTPSYDAETEVDATFPTDHVSMEKIKETALKFLGEQWQIPPMYSAIKVEGKKLYELARKGKNPARLAPRPVEIKSFEITSFDGNEIGFKACVSKGTYIRSLAFDFGKALESGAYLSSLRRTKIGPYSVENAMTIPSFLEFWKERLALSSSQTES
jgi:tRNA pseudouridine55 synthase